VRNDPAGGWRRPRPVVRKIAGRSVHNTW
jgi:hypothetical protein